MANIQKRVRASGQVAWQVKWRQEGRYASESFPSEALATQFRAMVDLAGQRSPEGWVPRVGFLGAPRAKSDLGPTLAEWFERAVDARPGANPRTRHDYRRDFGRHIPECLAGKPIEAINREDVGRWLTGLQGTLSPKTIHNLHGMISSVMKDAQVDGLITRNPFLGRSKAVPIKHEEMTFLTPEEFTELLGHVTEFYRPFVTLLFLTGLRWSEATALRREHVDLERKRIIVQTAWKRQPPSEDGTHFLSLEPKTNWSRRTVSITRALIELLRPIIAGKTRGDLVFVSKAGNRIGSGTFYNDVWNPARKRAEAAGFAKHPRVHDLRHSHAAILLSAGVPALVVSRRLGHANTAITTDLYGHVMPDANEALLGVLEGVLGARSAIGENLSTE